MTTNTETIIESALHWALEHAGSTDYPGLCYAFCEDAYERGAGIILDGQGTTAKEAADAYGLHTEGVPPRGSYVFYDCWTEIKGEYKNWGHMGLALGDGRVVHTWGQVRVDDFRALEALPQPNGWPSPVYTGWVPPERFLIGMTENPASGLPMFSIETPRLVLRDLLETDLQPFFALFSDPTVLHFQTYIQVKNEAEALEWLKGAAFHNNKIPREAYNLGILRKQDGAWLGWIGIGGASSPDKGDLDFGYALDPRCWSQGYMTEALRGLLDYCFRELDVTLITGECEIENPGSARVMEKAGLRRILAFDEVDEPTGRTKHMLRYAVSREEWERKPPF